MVVISIVGILAGATVFRMVDTSQANELGMAANLVQSALNQAREMARSPKPSGDINSVWDVNGYGVVFNLKEHSGDPRPDTPGLFNSRFIVFMDKKSGVCEGIYNVSHSPDCPTNNWDKRIEVYDFADVSINKDLTNCYWYSNPDTWEWEYKCDLDYRTKVYIKKLKIDGEEVTSLDNNSFVFNYSELPSEDKVHFNGVKCEDSVVITIKHIAGDQKEVKINCTNLITEIN